MNDSARNRANGFYTMGSNTGNASGGSGGTSKKGNGGGLKFLGISLLVLLLVITAFNSTYQIREQEQAVLITFGKAQAVTDPGLHFKIPYIQQVRKVNTTIQGLSIVE